MDFSWQKILGTVAPAIGAVLTGGASALVPAALNIVKDIFTDVDVNDDKAMAQALLNATPEQKLALIQQDQNFKLEVERLRQSDQKMQLDAAAASDANQTQLLLADANSDDKFRSRGRPAAVWVCVAALALQGLFYPVATWVAAVWAPEVKLPAPDLALLLTNLGGLLGLGGYRTLEKKWGKA